MTTIKQLFESIKNSSTTFFILRFFALPTLFTLTGLLFMAISQSTKLSDQTVFYSFIGFICVEILLLVFCLIKEIFKLHKTLKTFKRNIDLFIFLIYTTTFLVLYFMFVADHFRYSEVSPDGKYKLDVYTKQSFFALPGGGGLYDRSTKVVLKNSWGWTIGKSSDDCSVSYGDINIEWDVKNSQVFFSKTASININTGECTE